ncbi:hypothetical protein CSZ94_22390 [Janthinobacterium sp. ROICE36]|uniref:non-ribosomal peptide synthetase n=1 Tax=Janthinobacterium sp. ROICE36 TaxID=2048670 RepID=UPI000C7F0334|nr:non-ribosomal peptide synthetase [Janthinobacterium sp. ROICE36]PLY40170.1 hypothetical protein CSZ94_22390 [Janthinobacterium sp. ROICE36]
MEFDSLLQLCQEKNISLSLDGTQLKVTAAPGTLTADVAALLRQFKPQLLEWTRDRDAFSTGAIQRADRDHPLPASAGQRQLWLVSRFDAVGQAYHFCRVLDLEGALDLAALHAAFTGIVAAHESLRTVFYEIDGELFQRILPPQPVPIGMTELDSADADAVLAIEESLFAAPFDLTADAPLRMHLIRLDAYHHRLVVVLHHIASDGWSLGILVKSLQDAYVGCVSGPAPAIQYADYAQWLAAPLQLAQNAASLDYWRTALADAPSLHGLPTDFVRPAERSFRGQQLHQQLDAEAADGLRCLAASVGATPFMLLETLFGALVTRYSGNEDVIIGTPMANRRHEDIWHLIGYFVNLVPLRHAIDARRSFRELLASSKEETLRAFAHQQLPFDDLVRACAPVRSSSFGPLVQLCFVLQNNDIPALSLGDVSCVVERPASRSAMFDLQLEVTEDAAGFALCWEYATDLFTEETAARMARTYLQLAHAVIKHPDLPLARLATLDATERDHEIATATGPCVERRGALSLPAIFEAHAAAAPDALALACGATQLTYTELNARANQLAHWLAAERGVGPDVLVGICIERSIEMVVAILAVLKAGGAYVPLDPSYPEARLAYILDDAALTTVLTTRAVHARTPLSAGQALYLDDPRLAGQPDANLGRTVAAHHLAYVIYTSGSTGNPKGVTIEHGALSNLAFGVRDMDLIAAGETWGWLASYAFDASVQGISQLALGCPLYVVSDDARRDPALLAPSLASIDVLDCAPMLVEAWFAAGLAPQLPNLIIGGEAISPALWDTLVDWQATYGKTAVNVYGPTECTVDSTWCVVAGPRPHIGRPLPNTSAYVLDAASQLAGQGIAGELHIGGLGLGRGYLNRDELTAEKFIASPLAAGERLYKTGDLVRRLADGNLEYLGRIDQQVKNRGFRIELGEIESALKRHEAIREALVVAQDGVGGKRLVAYVVPHQAISNDALRQYLGQALPDYMVPSAFVHLEALPLTTNGKVDRKALPPADLAVQQVYLAPRTALEHELCALWQEILGVAQVGLGDNFFALGGHSLSATRLVARINQRFGVQMPLKDLFGLKTLEELGRHVATLDRSAARPALVAAPRGATLLPSYAQQRLWMLDQIDGGSTHYNMPSALRLTGKLDQTALRQALATIVERHESLRTCFVATGDGTVVQSILPAGGFSMGVEDLSALLSTAQTSAVNALLAQDGSTPFGLGADLMLRARLLRLAPEEHILLVTMHHIASDGWSMAILVNELGVLYQAFADGRDHALLALPIQYADYAHWQRHWLQGAVLDEQLGYWERQLAHLPVVHGLPLDHPRPRLQSFHGAVHASAIDASITSALHTLCREHGATLFMGLHAAFATLLARYSNETDIVVGSPIANREQAEVANLIGFFVNTLVLRSDLDGEPSFHALLAQSKRTLLDAYAHQQVPFEQIVERLRPERSLNHSPLFQVMLVLQNNEEGTLDLPGLALEPVAQPSVVAKYELTLTISESGGGLQMGWSYNSDLFAPDTVIRMADNFGRLLEALVASPDRNVMAAPLIGRAEHARLLGWDMTLADFPRERCMQAWFETRAAEQPDAVALVFGEEQVTYTQLDMRANQLAHILIEQYGVGADMVVGVCLERSAEMVVAIMAVLKAGGAVLPVKPSHGASRLRKMLTNAALATVLSTRDLLARTGIDGALCLDDAQVRELLAQQRVDSPAPRASRHDLAGALAAQAGHQIVLHVLDRHGSLTPLGVAGELHLGGTGLAHHTQDRMGTIAGNFVASPVSGGERLYRTGDMVRRLPQGALEYLGRIERRTGKRALRSWASEVKNPEHAATAGQAPCSETEQLLAGLWQEVLGVAQVNVDDNFFHSGGHSLLAMRLIASVNQSFEVRLPVKTLFDRPTLGGLADAIDQLDAGLGRPPLVAALRDGALPASYSQQRLWTLAQIDGGSAHYNISGALNLSGTLDVVALEHAFARILHRHESLRTNFDTGPDQDVLQVIRHADQFSLDVHDLVGMPADERLACIDSLTAIHATTPFDLAADLMLRAQLIRTNATEHVLLVTVHHIAADGWSMSILIDELCTLYHAFSRGESDPLPRMAIQYADYAVWQRNWLQGDVLDRQLDYWLQQLQDLPVEHQVPLDRIRPQSQTFTGASHISLVKEPTVSELRRLCAAEGATLFMGLHAALAAFLSRYSGQHDIVIGTPVANREQAEVAALIGFFANTLVLRSDLTGDPSFAVLLGKSKRTLLDAYTHQQVPFEQIVERINPVRSMRHSPLFQIMLAWQEADEGGLELPSLVLSPVRDGGVIAKFDLTLNVQEENGALRMNWVYSTDLFDAQTIIRMAGHFERLLASLTATPHACVFDTDLLAPPEYQQLLACNDSVRAFPDEANLHELFSRQAHLSPNAVALVFEGDVMTYAELDTRSNRLAHHLARHHAVGPDILVGVCTERSFDMVVAMLAVLKAGGAYVPLDPSLPPERLAYMVADAAPRLVLTRERLVEHLPQHCEQVLLDAHACHWASLSATEPTVDVLPGHLAYVIYTSGSTGNPKGVMIEHGAIANQMRWLVEQFGFDADDRVLQKTAYGFDAAVWEFWAPLICGARLVLARPDGHLDPRYMVDIIQQNAITVVQYVPSMLTVLTGQAGLDRCKSLRQIFCGGEALPGALVQQLFSMLPQVAVHNLYGPTECTIDASYWTCIRGRQADVVPIGYPVANTQLHVLDQHGRQVPQGVLGELYIGGAQLARGYLGHPALTAEKFIPDPYSDIEGARLYKTGDLVRRLPDGAIHYCGRSDFQIKLRGLRIEPGEIEAALRRLDGVADAIVVANSAASGDYLVAYLVRHDEGAQISAGMPPWGEHLRSELARVLPAYMVPAVIVQLVAMPLNANGKIDRKRLPSPAVQEHGARYVAPRNHTEKQLCRIWEELLGRERVGIDDDFFHLGGHSLLAVRMVSMVGQHLDTDIAVRSLFIAPTVAALAALIDTQTAAPYPNLVTIRPAWAGSALPLFLVHPGEGEVGYATDLAPMIDGDVPVYALAAIGFLAGETVLSDIGEMAAAYVAAVRHVQPVGPYRIAGWSAGGTIACAMAAVLQTEGETVELVGLLDTSSDYQGLAARVPSLTGNPDCDDLAVLMGSLGEDEQTTLAAVAGEGLAAVLDHCRTAKILPAAVDLETLRRHVAVRASITRALASWRPAPVAVPVALVLARTGGRCDAHQRWSRLCQAQLDVTVVEGDHYSMMEAQHIGAVAGALNAALRRNGAEIQRLAPTRVSVA